MKIQERDCGEVGGYMAKRRMFSNEVVCTDDFLRLSATSQAIYLQLGMVADDDGFVANPKMIARAYYAGLKFLKELIDKGYVLQFETGVIVVTHWNLANKVPKDRYCPTQFTEELAQVAIEKGRYTKPPR